MDCTQHPDVSVHLSRDNLQMAQQAATSGCVTEKIISTCDASVFLLHPTYHHAPVSFFLSPLFDFDHGCIRLHPLGWFLHPRHTKKEPSGVTERRPYQHQVDICCLPYSPLCLCSHFFLCLFSLSFIIISEMSSSKGKERNFLALLSSLKERNVSFPPPWPPCPSCSRWSWSPRTRQTRQNSRRRIVRRVSRGF